MEKSRRQHCRTFVSLVQVKINVFPPNFEIYVMLCQLGLDIGVQNMIGDGCLWNANDHIWTTD